MNETIPVRVLKQNPEAVIPEYMSPGAAGCDIRACIEESLEILPGEREAIPTGLAVAIPEGYEIQVRPRSGLSYKKGLTVVNAPGTIDSDYRGEIKVLAINLGRTRVVVEPGDRIAQLVLCRVPQIQWVEADDLDTTKRDAGGFGSTGV